MSLEKRKKLQKEKTLKPAIGPLKVKEERME